jgi:hypothetical protein
MVFILHILCYNFLPNWFCFRKNCTPEESSVIVLSLAIWSDGIHKVVIFCLDIFYSLVLLCSSSCLLNNNHLVKFWLKLHSFRFDPPYKIVGNSCGVVLLVSAIWKLFLQFDIKTSCSYVIWTSSQNTITGRKNMCTQCNPLKKLLYMNHVSFPKSFLLITTQK